MDDKKYVPYSATAAEKYDRVRTTERHHRPLHHIEVAILHRFVNGCSRSDSIAEIGVGTARLLEALADGKRQLVGIDLSEDMLSMAKAKQLRNARFIQGESSELPLADESFDIVYSIRLLNQLPSAVEAEATIREMARICAPGGFVMIEFVNRFGLVWRSRLKLAPRAVRHHATTAGLLPRKELGSLFFGQGVLRYVPHSAMQWHLRIDRYLSHRLPRLASRCYFVYQKG